MFIQEILTSLDTMFNMNNTPIFVAMSAIFTIIIISIYDSFNKSSNSNEGDHEHENQCECENDDQCENNKEYDPDINSDLGFEQNNNHRRDIRALQRTEQRLEKSNQEFGNTILKLTKNILLLKDEKDHLQIGFNILLQENINLGEQNEDLGEQKGDLTHQNNVLEKKNDDLEEQINELLTENEERGERKRDLEKECDDLKKQLDDLLNDVKDSNETIILSNDVIRKLKSDIQHFEDVDDEVDEVELSFNEKYPTLIKALSVMTINQLTNATTKTDLNTVNCGQQKNKVYFIESVLTTILRKGKNENNISVDFVCEDRHKLSTETRQFITEHSSTCFKELLNLYSDSLDD